MLLIRLYTHTYEWNPTLFHFFLLFLFYHAEEEKDSCHSRSLHTENAGAVKATPA